MITSFYIKGFVYNGVQLGWRSSDYASSYILESSTSIEGPWSFIRAVSSEYNEATINKAELFEENHNVFRLTEYGIGNSIEDDAVITVNLDRISAGPLMPIAVDSNGIPRLLKTDAGGNLLVTSIGDGASGYGDASEGLQIQQLTALNSSISKLEQVKAAIDAVTSKMADVRLNSAQISDLKTVAVSNMPTDFPDEATHNILTSIHAFMAKDSSMATAVSLLAQLLKKTDLDLSASGEVSTLVKNIPTDFPDAAASLRLSDIDTRIAQLVNAVSMLKPHVESIDVESARTSNIGHDSLLSIASIKDELYSVSALISQLIGISGLISTASESSASNTAGMLSNTSNILKKEDLPISPSGNMKAEVANFPAVYPNPLVLAEIESLRTDATSHTSTLISAISAPISEGTNKIGIVSVDNAILPDNAAKESTLVDINSRISYLISQYISASPGTHKALLNNICAKLDSIKAAIVEPSAAINLYETTSPNFVAANSTFVTNSVSNPTSGKLMLSVASNSPLGMLVTVNTSADGSKYWPLSGFIKFELIGNRMHIIDIPATLNYVKVEVVNPSIASAINNVYVRIDAVK